MNTHSQQLQVGIYDSRELNGEGDIADFLSQFKRYSALILFKGKDSQRPCRIITTLLHGNEPSGVYALQRLITNQTQPICDTYVFVASVRAATAEPLFYFRMLPEHRDLNRCFSDINISDQQGALALYIKEFIRGKRPELLMDMHNTSGESPAFSVSHVQDRRHASLCLLFSPFIIHSTIKVGALFEQDFNCPNVTIECGGAANEMSHEIAYTGLHRIFRAEISELKGEAESPVWLNNPLRLELKADTKLAYADSPCPQADLTLPLDIDSHNFGVWGADRPLGWLGDRGMNIFTVKGAQGKDHLADLFTCRNRQLFPAVSLHLFMITNRADIALSDCLLYAVPC
ncbi:succinylglutamate desuccinylase/aspartoacylase domain-containing protein [Psychromonas ossibalaenae]|uniref:succinylglutamate desuccinylase/aspartoacylase domain-containing protein n=1 Tax=Psychromonas ossibalaenae TaxID=444922 RepID=UPI00037C41DA|nr:succinylglutamate desuccinylase/aspartoacylase family protein [Psychromonas ossibalaenae]